MKATERVADEAEVVGRRVDIGAIDGESEHFAGFTRTAGPVVAKIAGPVQGVTDRPSSIAGPGCSSGSATDKEQ